MVTVTNMQLAVVGESYSGLPYEICVDKSCVSLQPSYLTQTLSTHQCHLTSSLILITRTVGHTVISCWRRQACLLCCHTCTTCTMQHVDQWNNPSWRQFFFSAVHNITGDYVWHITMTVLPSCLTADPFKAILTVLNMQALTHTTLPVTPDAPHCLAAHLNAQRWIAHVVRVTCLYCFQAAILSAKWL